MNKKRKEESGMKEFLENSGKVINKLTRDQKKFYADCMVEEYNNKQKEYSSNYICGTERNLQLGEIHGHNYYSNEEVHPGPRVDRDQQTLPGVDWSVVDWSVYDN